MDFKKYRDFVEGRITRRTVLEQIAEEASEVSQAALKLIRAEKLSENVTPIDAGKAWVSLWEEIADLAMVASLITTEANCAHSSYANPKWKRWASRLGYVDTKKKVSIKDYVMGYIRASKSLSRVYIPVTETATPKQIKTCVKNLFQRGHLDDCYVENYNLLHTQKDGFVGFAFHGAWDD